MSRHCDLDCFWLKPHWDLVTHRDCSACSLVGPLIWITDPIFQVLRKRQPEITLTELTSQLVSVQKWEEQGNRALSWQCQDRLCAVDGANIFLGLDASLLSPHIPHGWANLDPDTWSEDQKRLISQADALVVLLSGDTDTQLRLLSYLRSLMARHLKLITLTTSAAGTPATNRLNKLLEFSKLLGRLTVKCPVWQAKGQWQKRPEFLQKWASPSKD